MIFIKWMQNIVYRKHGVPQTILLTKILKHAQQVAILQNILIIQLKCVLLLVLLGNTQD